MKSEKLNTKKLKLSIGDAQALYMRTFLGIGDCFAENQYKKLRKKFEKYLENYNDGMPF